MSSLCWQLLWILGFVMGEHKFSHWQSVLKIVVFLELGQLNFQNLLQSMWEFQGLDWEYALQKLSAILNSLFAWILGNLIVQSSEGSGIYQK